MKAGGGTAPSLLPTIIYWPAKMELALKLFLVILATELVSLLGKTVLIDFVCSTLLKCALAPCADSATSLDPTRPQAFSLFQAAVQGPALKANRTLKRETLEAKLELDRTSSQDEFAKWAKLRRKLDKLVVELEKSSARCYGRRLSIVHSEDGVG